MSRPKKEYSDLQRNLVKVYLTDDQLEILEKCQYVLNCSKSQVMTEGMMSLFCFLNVNHGGEFI